MVDTVCFHLISISFENLFGGSSRSAATCIPSIGKNGPLKPTKQFRKDAHGVKRKNEDTCLIATSLESTLMINRITDVTPDRPHILIPVGFKHYNFQQNDI